MNLKEIEVLEYIINNTDKLDHHAAAKRITKKIISEKSLENLSKDQEKIFNEVILPLLEPPCEGVMGWVDHDTCSGGGTVDIESLLQSYREDQMLCQLCRYDKAQRDNG